MVLNTPIGSLMPYKRFKLFLDQQAHGHFNRLNFKTMFKNKKNKEKVKRFSQLSVINPTAAGIDVSDTEMVVAFPINSEQIEVRAFGSFTRDLKLLANTLQEYGITTIAMESTGVYWVTLFLLLQEYGFEVYLVNAKHVKNVTGRKDDESDAEWIQKLHSCGLLSASFQPDNMTRALRSMVRHRKGLVSISATYLNRIQKALELMNIKLHTVISDIDGRTGRNIIEAILSGEKDPEVLAELRDIRIKASREEIIKSLEGHWLPEHLFELKQCYQLYCIHREMIDLCDKEIEQQLIQIIASKNEGIIAEIPEAKRKRSPKHPISYNLTGYLKKLVGVDLTSIIGISELSALSIIAEIGTDMSRWKTRKEISSRILKKKQYAAQSFRMAVLSLNKNKSPLGDFYKRIRAKAGPGKAVVATARKLAIIFYEMLIKKELFNPKALEEYQKKHNQMKINQLKKKIAQLELA